MQISRLKTTETAANLEADAAKIQGSQAFEA
jgi:hypothetical protein